MIKPLMHLLPLGFVNEDYHYSCAKNMTGREAGHQEHDCGKK